MSASFTGNPGAFVPNTYLMPESSEELRVRLYEYLNDLSQALNVKTTGFYLLTEVITGQLFIPTFSTTAAQSTVLRTIFRTLVETGTLSTGANAVAHSLPVAATWNFVKIYGVITDSPSTTWVPIPNEGVTVTVDTTNINITIPSAYNSYAGQVVLEYTKE